MWPNMQPGDMDRDSGRWSPQMASMDGNMGKMFSDAREVDSILRTLQLSAEHDELRSALLRLGQLFNVVPHYLEDNHVYLSVLSTMTHMMSDMDIQQLGVEILSTFMRNSQRMEDKIVRKLDVFNHIVKLLSENPGEQQIKNVSVQILVRLLASDLTRLQVTHNKQWSKLMEAVMKGIMSSQNTMECLYDSLYILILILNEDSQSEPDQRELLTKKYLHVILRLLKQWTRNANIVRALFKLLHMAAGSAPARARLPPDVLTIVLEQMKLWQEESTVVLESLNLIEVLCTEDKFLQSLMEKGFFTDTLLSEMMSRTEETGIQLSGLKIFNCTAEHLFRSVKQEALAYQWLKVIFLAMSRHMDKPKVQALGCEALAKLLECKPEIYMWIGENSQDKQDPLHALCLGAILMYDKDVDVFVSACKAIYYLTADNDALCKTLMEKNPYIAIIPGLSTHIKNPKAIMAGCSAIRGLSIFQIKHKIRIAEYDGDLLQLLQEVIRAFVDNADVQSEVISTIACLADLDLIRHQCFVVNLHQRILEAMDNFPGDKYLQEAALEALAVLGGAASGPEILYSNGAIDKIIKCLKRFVYDKNIQKKGLMAIQILADKQLVQSTAMCKELALLIRSTMRNHTDSLVIQKEAIVAMQILAERGVEGDRREHYSNMAEILVNEGCHELLFQILEKFDNVQGLHDLASECLYVIGIEQDLTSRMLLAACSKGFLAGAECLLEVGANINVGEGKLTPLYHAVGNNNESMVALLLQHEVRDVQTSLKLSLERGYHTITGMLLSHVGRDTETGTVSWSSFNLGDLRPEWIMPTLLGEGRKTLSSSVTSVTSKHFVSKIQSSKERRIQRILRSRSESNLEIMRHKCFRYQRSSEDAYQQLTIEAIQERQQNNGKQKRPITYHGENSHQPSRTRILGRDLTPKTDEPTVSLTVTDDTSPLESLLPSHSVDDAPLFEHSEDEWQDWKKTTLTGANIPFSPADPRRPSSSESVVLKKNRYPPGQWMRKFTSKEGRQRSNREFNTETNSNGSLKNTKREDPRNLTPSSHGSLTRKVSADSTTDSLASLTISASSSGISNIWDTYSSENEVSMQSRRSSVFSTQSADDTDFADDQPKQGRQPEHSIRTLDLSANQIASLDHLVAGSTILLQNFAKLEDLDLSNNNLCGLPDQLFQSLTGLQILNLSNNRLTEFPESIKFCTSLDKLDVSSNKIENVSFDQQIALSLTELKICKNGIREFPKGLEKAFPHLTMLDISSNNISELPNEPCCLNELRCLDMSHNVVQVLPDDFFTHLVKLEVLTAVNNQLETLPSESVAAVLNRLSTVKLNNNNITGKEPCYVPKFILQLPNVRTVDLSWNSLLGFPPPTMWKTSLLKDLMMSRNKITKLNMEGARQWSKLEKLHLAHNKIAELPREIGYLTSLQSLDLSHNKPLATLPDELGQCSRLWEMPLDGLSLDLDDALIKGRVKELTIYLHNKLKKAQRYFRMKLMVVGYGGKGKTSLLQALKRKIKNTVTEKPPVTVGIIVDDWKYERQSFGKTVTYTLNTWDFAGQEDFYSTHQCFLSNRTLYLVVYDISMGTDEIDKLKPWLSNIHARAPGCPVVLVGTHYDLLPVEERDTIVAEFEEKLKELLHKPGFPAINCFAIVDLSKETPELEQLRRKVKDIVDEFKIKGQPVMGQKVPASYVKLGEILHEEAKHVEKSFPVIRHGQLVRLVRTRNLDLDEDEELKQAINFLHESGVLLHFNETALQMRDFYFINPGWLCRMMAQVVTVPQINPFIDRNGIMKRSSAALLFTGKETSGDNNFVFPASLIPQYLHLLEKFEIALPRNQEQLLIPSRLPNRKPNFELPVQNQTELVFRFYVLPYTPIGFWSRLLTRLIVFSESRFIENMLYLQENPLVQYWKEGIFVKWSHTAFFLVDSYKSSSEEIHITVPNTSQGCRLLGHLVDHVDSLVDEWYPGLTAIDPMLGRELLEKFVPCTICTVQPHYFRFEELLKQSEHHTEIHCPEHNGTVELVKLAPDVMLADIEPHFHLDQDQFEFNESLENLCGDGGFGSVYKAKYKDKVVAVKVFSAIGDIHPHKMLRQEATILRRLKHPSVVSLVAVAVRPVRLVVMEFAPNKSLGEVLKSGHHLSRSLQLKISQQVAEGLAYMHSLMIIYRDMKPDNVLVFSLAPDAVINAKIADYGISQFTNLFGLTAQEGTPAYRAPEVVRGETYSFQADIFSFGILMYMVLTGGVHPFDELEFKSEIDKAFAENLPIPPITQRGCPPWPDFQDLITQCLSQVPDDRPRAQEVFERLSCAELFSLREVLMVSVDTTVECMAAQTLGNKTKTVRVWVASGDNEYIQLTWLNLLDYRDETQLIDRNRQSVDYSGMGTMFQDGRILCILPVNQEYILLGTQAGKIWVFSAASNKLVHSSCYLGDSVLSLFLIQSRGDDPLVLAGLNNGHMALYPLSEVLQGPELNPFELKLGESYEPVRCILRSGVDRKLIASCGTKIVLFVACGGVAVEKIIDTVRDSNSSSLPISSMACGRHLFIAHRNSDVLQTWDTTRWTLKFSLNISKILNLSVKEGRINSMVLHDSKTLWVGTGGGQIVLVDAKNCEVLQCTHRHTAPVRSLLAVKVKGSVKYGPNSSTSVILSGGLGFKNKLDADTDKLGCIGVWDADFPLTVKQFSDWSKKRKETNESEGRRSTM